MSNDCCGINEAGQAVCELNESRLEGIETENHNCPECGKKGKLVDTQTVKALLSKSLRAVQKGGYRFCKDETCPVVYYSNESGSIFSGNDLRVRVYQKHPQDRDVPICYCFRHAVGDVFDATEDERAEVLADINQGIADGQCACDVRNPQGSCCLGNVRAMVKELSTKAESSKLPESA
jgi:hypothetical protein